jgi:hypothetical protein
VPRARLQIRQRRLRLVRRRRNLPLLLARVCAHHCAA